MSRRCSVAGALIGAILGAAAPALAQTGQRFVVGTGQQHDKVRASGFIWRGNVGGTLDLRELDGVPGLEDGIDVEQTLGLTEANMGWMFEVNAAAGRRHRFIFVISRLEHEGEQNIAIPLSRLGPLADIIIAATSTMSLREVHGFYNFLFVATPQVEVGVLGGIGYFDAEATVDTIIGDAAGKLDTPFPTFGGNLLVNPKGPVRGYFELTGFPRVTVNEISGYQMDLNLRGEFFIARNVGALVGYRRYQLVFDEGTDGTNIDLTWDGFVFGGQVRF